MTDAMEFHIDTSGPYVWAYDARKIECELNAWKVGAHAEQERAIRCEEVRTTAAPLFDAVQLSEARFYCASKDPIGILARAILRANGETP